MSLRNTPYPYTKAPMKLFLATLAFFAVHVQATPTGQDRVDYFIDGSGSMCGFLKANDPAGTFQKIVTVAMQSKDAKRERRVFLLGSDGKKPTVSEAPDDLAAKVAQQPAATTKGACASFIANDSHLDGVFARVKQTPGTSMILVTDLLLKEAELTSFVENMRDWALAPANDAAHVGFITLQTPFDGPYYQVSGGKTNPGRHIRPLTVVWFAASAAGRAEVRHLLAKLGVSNVGATGSAKVATSGSKSGAGSPSAPQATPDSSQAGGIAIPASSPGNEAAVPKVMFKLQVLPQLTSEGTEWLVPLPERGLDKWLDVQLRMMPGSGRNPNSVDNCASVQWAGSALQLTVRERCNDKELFPFKQTSALVTLRPKPATGLVLEGLNVAPIGATRCAVVGPKAAIAPCSEPDWRSDTVQLYRLPVTNKGNEPPQQIELQLRMPEIDVSKWAAEVEGLDLASDICAASGTVNECKIRLDGKVYRYATFVAQIVGRAKTVIQQRVETWPRVIPMQVKVIP